MTPGIRRCSALVAVAAVLLAGCDTSGDGRQGDPATAPTLRTLFDAEPESTKLERTGPGKGVEGIEAFPVTYESDGLTITGQLVVPTAPGPHPGVVMVHGLVDAATYSSRTGMIREQLTLAAAGYVVLAPDLRNVGDSDDAPDGDSDAGVGGTQDVLNAVRALEAESEVDPERTAIVGLSLGGQLAMNAMVVEPDAVRAVVALAPASSLAWQTFSRIGNLDPEVRDKVVEAHGTGKANPTFWADVSARTFVDRAEVPLLIVHGTADDVAPFSWSKATAKAWEAAGKDVRLVPVEGEDHFFAVKWDQVSTEMMAFLAQHLAP